jgi:membrane protein required for colicin V production
VNWVDATVLAVVAISAIAALVRGFVREVLGIAAWVGAGFFAVATAGLVRPKIEQFVPNPDLSGPIAYGGMFLIALIVLSIVVGIFGGAVRNSVLGGVDRTLGLVFGILRGVVLCAAVYYFAGLVVTTDRWPEPVKQARSLPYIASTAAWIMTFVPQAWPAALPPLGRSTTAEDLLHVAPQGYAFGHAAGAKP